MAAVHELTSRLGLDFDAVLGFSAGALTGAGYFLNRQDEALERWRRTEESRILRLSPRLFPPTIFSGEPLWESVVSARDEEHAREHGRCRLIVVSTRRQERKPVYAVFSPREGRWDGSLAHHLVGSCAIPGIFPPVEAHYQGEPMTLMDGGIRTGEPMSFASLSDCKDVIVLDMVRPEEVGRPRYTVSRILDQQSREASRLMVDEGIASLRTPAADRRIFRLNPSRVLDFSMLSFKAIHIQEGLRRGIEDARAFFSNPMGALV